MIKLYFKQAFFQLRENRLISLVSIIGTALAICMIMVIVLVLEVRITDCVPEVNRSRSLYMKAMSIHQKGDTSDNSSNGCMSLTVAKECFKALTVPETVTIVSTGGRMRISVPAGKMMTVDNLETDDTFWKVFSFDFIAGKPFTAADSESGLPKVVISASVARNLFGTVEAVGRTVQLNLADYTVVGVVKDVSKLAVSSYAQIWIPFNSTEIARKCWYDNVMGTFRVVILAHSEKDFPAIREEVERLRQKFNDGLQDSEIFYRGQPDDRFSFIFRHWGRELQAKEAYLYYLLVIVILLLVPAINLSSMTLSRMRKRMSEIGVRKAFGATANVLLRQVFYENLLLTLIAGAVGMLFRNNPIMCGKYFDEPLGILKAGAAADVIIMEYKPYTPLSAENIDGHLIFGMNGHNCITTMANGKLLMRDRRLVDLDEEKINADIMETAKKLWKNING